MFGFAVCNRAKLSDEERARYQSVSCGLCRRLKEKYGNRERLSLNCDMTFLALVLSSLYEPEDEIVRKFTCGLHPFQRREELLSPYVEYAADMTVLYSCYKCLDGWRDDKDLIRYHYARYLRRHLPEIEEKYPRQCRRFLEGIRRFSAIESGREPMSDARINAVGEILTELFVYREDGWSGYLRKFGFELGRFLYLMDAVIDAEEEKRSGRCNPFLRNETKMEIQDAERILQVMIGNAAEQFEMLPLSRDEHLLKSILYDGVWTQFRMKTCRKEKNPDGRSAAGNFGSCQASDLEERLGAGRRVYGILNPARMAGDSETICQAVDFINIGRYGFVEQVLNTVSGEQRDARWHYLKSLANYGMGNVVAAMMCMRKALELEPDNLTYREVGQGMYRSGNTYRTNGQDYRGRTIP